MEPIDIHTHLFNLKYLPVAGIFRNYSNGKLPVFACRAIERYLWRHTNETQWNDELNIASLSATSAPTLVEILSANNVIVNNPIESFSLREILTQNSDNVLDQISYYATESDMEDADLFSAMDAIINLFPEIQITENQLPIQFNLTEENADYHGHARALEKIALFFRRIKKILETISNGVIKIERFFKWVYFMMKSEEEIYQCILSDNHYGISKMVVLMMDVDSFFQYPGDEEYNSYFDFRTEQTQRMLNLYRAHQDKIIPFIAIDPSKPDATDFVISMIGPGAFKGVKIYPPMGYKPWNDSPKNEREQIIQTQLAQLYQHSHASKTPLFTHCTNHGFQTNNSGTSGYNSNPKFWAKALENFPDMKICFGHAGGGDGWFAPIQEHDIYDPDQIAINDSSPVDDEDVQKTDWNISYCAAVFKLCSTYKNAYCDLSYINDMLDENGHIEDQKLILFKDRLLKVFNSNTNFKDKVMYGSDWHMLYQEDIQAVYFDRYVDLFDDTNFINYKDQFFNKNAERYLS